eukprot:gene1702-1984_t
MARVLFEYLTQAGYQVHHLTRGDEVEPWLAEHPTELVLLDLMLLRRRRQRGFRADAEVKEALCIDRVRSHEERQRVALQARFGALQPKLSEAVTLMEANIEEPLSTDDIANLVGLSRRQLERLFKQYLGSRSSWRRDRPT